MHDLFAQGNHIFFGAFQWRHNYSVANTVLYLRVCQHFHNKPLFSLEAEIELNPAMDLNCVCSNCHRMIHRRAEILSVKELRSIIKNNK